MATTESYSDVLASRYGLDRSNWATRILMGLAVTAFAAALTWAAVGLSRPRIEANLIRWEAQDQRALVELEVRGTSSEPVACVLRAQDADTVDIGYREFRIERSPTTVSLDLPTLFPPASVGVLGCAPAGEPLRVPPPDLPPGVALP